MYKPATGWQSRSVKIDVKDETVSINCYVPARHGWSSHVATRGTWAAGQNQVKYEPCVTLSSAYSYVTRCLESPRFIVFYPFFPYEPRCSQIWPGSGQTFTSFTSLSNTQTYSNAFDGSTRASTSRVLDCFFFLRVCPPPKKKDIAKHIPKKPDCW